MAVTSLILSLRPEPDITFHECVFESIPTTVRANLHPVSPLHSALVVFYLLAFSTSGIFFTSDRPMVRVVCILEGCTVSGFTLFLWITAKTFGSMPACNANAFLFLYVPIHALKPGRTIALVLTSLSSVSHLGRNMSALFKAHDDPKDSQARWAFGA